MSLHEQGAGRCDPKRDDGTNAITAGRAQFDADPERDDGTQPPTQSSLGGVGVAPHRIDTDH